MKTFSPLLFAVVALQLAACASVPTSPRADEVRARVMPWVQWEMAQQGISLNADLHLIAFKEEKVLEAWMEEPLTGSYKLFKSWPICNFSGGLGPKKQEGDLQAPEGFYQVTANQLNPNSQFHLAFNIGYPNDYDRARGYNGSAIMVHGDCQSKGCFAMTDDGIEQIYMLVEHVLRHGQTNIPIDIYPFRMTEENLARHAGSPHRQFWLSMKDGYDSFEEKTGTPDILQIVFGS